MALSAATARLSVYVFFSGACALLYQTVWQRDLRLIFGGSTAASGAVLAAFIGGLGAGSLLLARRVERSPRPFGLYARFEMIIAVSTALTPYLFDLVRGAYVSLGGTQALGSFGGSALRFVLTALAIFVPTFFMGGTLPAVARSVTSDDDTHRGGVALLYGLNTLGAVSGAALATFFLLPDFGNHTTLWLGCAVNLAVALAAQVRARTLPEVPVSEPQPAAPTASTPAAAAEAELSHGLVLGAAFAVGAVFFLMEMVWFRMLSPLLGGTVFTFGLVLCVALAGIGLGGAFYGALASRVRISLSTFAFTCLLEALAVAIPLGLGDRLAHLALLLRPLVTMGLGTAAAGWCLVAAVVVFPAAFVAGVQFPALIALAGRARSQVAKHVAEVYAANTAGSMLGALAGGFGILTALGAIGTWRLAAAVLLGLGALAASLAGDTRALRRALPAGAIAAATLLCLLATGPTAVWRHSGIGQGRSDLQLDGRARLTAHERLMRRSFLWEKDGVEAGVALLAVDAYSFIVNGKSDGNAIDDSATQVMSGLLGAMLHPAPRSALVIGLGTGSSAGWLGMVPELERVQVYELEPVILDVARTMKAINHDVLQNPKVQIRVGDARELLALDPARYDIVFSEPSNPFRVGIANLYTREYYLQARARLQPGGLFIQWVQAYEIDAETVATAYATVRSVFPYVQTWFGSGGDLLLVGTTEPFTYDVDLIGRRVQSEPFRSALAYTWYATSKEGFFAHLLGGPAFANFMVEKTRLPANTDDNNRIEFGVARSLAGHSAVEANLFQLSSQFDARSERFPPGLDPGLLSLELWLAHVDRRRGSSGGTTRGLPTAEQPIANAVQLAIMGNTLGAAKAWPADRTPRTDTERLTRLLGWTVAPPPEFEAEADALATLFPFDTEMARALAAKTAHDEAKEIEHWEKAFAALRTNPWNQSTLLTLALDNLPRQPFSKPSLQRLANALSEPWAGNHLDSFRLRALLRFYERLEDHEACARVYAKDLKNLPFDVESLSRALDCFHAARPELVPVAERDLKLLKRLLPTSLEDLGARPEEPGGEAAQRPGRGRWLDPPDAGTVDAPAPP